MTKSDTLQAGELSKGQKKATPFLVNAPTVEGGCKGAKIMRKTYYQWLNRLLPVKLGEWSAIEASPPQQALGLGTSSCPSPKPTLRYLRAAREVPLIQLGGLYLLSLKLKVQPGRKAYCPMED
jgi:hypothetical protein